MLMTTLRAGRLFVSAWAGVIVLVPAVVAFMVVDRHYRLHFEFTLSHPIAVWLEAAHLMALARSSVVLCIAIPICFALTESIAAQLERQVSQKLLLALCVLPLALDPVVRAKGYRALGTYLVDIVPTAALPATELFQHYVLPAIAITAQYLPLFLLVRIGVSHTIPRVIPSAWLVDFALSRLARWQSVFAIQVSLLALLVLFDLWISPEVSGRKIHYLGNLIWERVGTRNVNAAAALTLLGGSALLMIYYAAAILARILDAAIVRVSPTRLFRADPNWSRLGRAIEAGVLWFGVAMLWAPIIAFAARGVEIFQAEGWTFSPNPLHVRAIVVTFAFGLFLAVASVAVGLVYYLDGLSRGWRRAFLFSCAVLAFAPEANFVICIVALKASGIAKASVAMTLAVMGSFLVPMVILVIRSAGSTSDHARLRMAAQALFKGRSMLRVANAVLPTMRFTLIAASCLSFWLFAENVIIASQTAPPFYKPFAIELFASLGRGGLSASELSGGILMWISKAALLLAVAWTISPFASHDHPPTGFGQHA